MTYSFMIIAAPDCPRGYLGQLPEHSPEKANKLLELLDWTKLEERRSTSVGISGAKRLGAYEKAYLLADQTLVGLSLRARAQSFLPAALKIFPTGTVFVMDSYNSSNDYHYVLYAKGELVREHAGNINECPTIEIGKPVEEEQAHYARSKIINGERIFFLEMMYRNRPQTEEFTVDTFGNFLGLAIASRFFGEVDSTNYPQCLKEDKLRGEVFC